MTRQKGPIKIAGTIGDLTFLKTQDGYMVREKNNSPGFPEFHKNSRSEHVAHFFACFALWSNALRLNFL